MAESNEFKEKRKVYARVLKKYAYWKSLVEAEGEQFATIKLPGGQEIHYMDVLEGFKVLPPRQRQAVWLMCVEDRSEAEVAQIMDFKNQITPVQQYKNFGLARLIEYQEASPEDRQSMLKRGSKYKKKGSSDGQA